MRYLEEETFGFDTFRVHKWFLNCLKGAEAIEEKYPNDRLVNHEIQFGKMESHIHTFYEECM